MVNVLFLANQTLNETHRVSSQDWSDCAAAQAIDWSESLQDTYEPQHDITNEMTYAPSDDSVQPGHPLCALWLAKHPKFLQVDSEDFDLTGRMPRLIWVFAGSTGNLVGFVVGWLFHLESLNIEQWNQVLPNFLALLLLRLTGTAISSCGTFSDSWFLAWKVNHSLNSVWQ